MKKVLVLIFLGCSLLSLSQTTRPFPPADSLLAFYQASLGYNSPLFNGRQFYGYSPKILDIPFYPGNEWYPGTVIYDGIPYKNVSLMYDAYKDELVIHHPNGAFYVLQKERVSRFTMKDKVFVHLLKGGPEGVADGYYQQLSSGKASVYARRTRILEERISGSELERKFVSKEQFFIFHDGTMHQVKKQKNVYSILRDKSTDLRKIARQQQLRFKDNPEQFLAQLTDYYNQH